MEVKFVLSIAPDAYKMNSYIDLVFLVRPKQQLYCHQVKWEHIFETFYVKPYQVIENGCCCCIF